MKIAEIFLLVNVSIAFVAFSLVASAIYVFNDYIDIEDDKLHSKKKKRPLVSGTITKKQAILIMFLLFMMGSTLMVLVSLKAAGVLFIYVLMNIFYSLYLKHIPILDVTIISLGFILRLFIGSVVTNISLSMWIVVMTFLLALFMALAKRRDDVLSYLDTGKKMRKVIYGYNLQFLDTTMGIMASVVIVSYILYTTSSEVIARVHSEYLYLTSFFVILGIMRYLQIIFVLKDSGSPTRIVLKDKFLQIILLGWILTFSWIIY